MRLVTLGVGAALLHARPAPESRYRGAHPHQSPYSRVCFSLVPDDELLIRVPLQHTNAQLLSPWRRLNGIDSLSGHPQCRANKCHQNSAHDVWAPERARIALPLVRVRALKCKPCEQPRERSRRRTSAFRCTCGKSSERLQVLRQVPRSRMTSTTT